MCRPVASSVIAGKYKKWNMEFPERKNWTSDSQAWDNFIASVDSSTIRRMHFMGGEPMLSKRFKELVDYLIATERNKTMSISFVTNGTILDQQFIDKLKTFKTFDIEISLESFSDNNHYIRQGLGNSTQLTVNNIKTLSAQQTDKFHVVLRSVPQLLNVNNYNEYIDTAWELQLPIQGIPLITPYYLAIKVLPLQLRQTFIDRYQQVIYKIKKNPLTKFTTFTTGRDVSRLDLQLVNEAEAIIRMLQEPEPDNVLELRAELCSWLQRWDNEFGLTAYDYYPEYQEFLQNIGYGIPS
jgi:MoaA/NifB/PqqE/SkfB family radical SAM enzyme